jgi:hypothetical protein
MVWCGGGVVRCEPERATLLIGFSIEKRLHYHISKLGTTACRRTETVFSRRARPACRA